MALVCSNSMISKSCDFHLSHLAILTLHIHIIIPMPVFCQFLEPIAWNPHIYPTLSCGFSPIIPSIISSSFYTLYFPWFYLQKLEGKPRIWEIFPYPIDSSSLKIRSNFHSKSSFEFNEVNWIQIYWTTSSFEIQMIMTFEHGLKSFRIRWARQVGGACCMAQVGSGQYCLAFFRPIIMVFPWTI
jgi:hypothetical protein